MSLIANTAILGRMGDDPWMASTHRGVLIRLFLVEGVPDGLWVVEKSNWTGVGLMCPRSSYPHARSREELTRPGVYVLVGPSESIAGRIRIYVGEADILSKRLDRTTRKRTSGRVRSCSRARTRI